MKDITTLTDAMTAWEAILDLPEARLTALQEEFQGMANLRDATAKTLPAMMRAYETARALEYDHCFDWEFLPDLFNRAWLTSSSAASFFEAIIQNPVQLGAQIAGFRPVAKPMSNDQFIRAGNDIPFDRAPDEIREHYQDFDIKPTSVTLYPQDYHTATLPNGTIYCVIENNEIYAGTVAEQKLALGRLYDFYVATFPMP